MTQPTLIPLEKIGGTAGQLPTKQSELEYARRQHEEAERKAEQLLDEKRERWSALYLQLETMTPAEDWASAFLDELEREVTMDVSWSEANADGRRAMTVRRGDHCAYPDVEITVMAHGAGTQTSALALLSAQNHFGTQTLRPGQEGYLHIDVATFANVADHGTITNEWPETIEYLAQLNRLTYLPIVIVQPYVWNDSLERQYDGRGLFDRFYDRATMPYRSFRGCTDMFKIVPQQRFLNWLIDEAGKFGVNLHIRQVIGYSADEAHRAKRFSSPHPNIRPWFPLIEWGWKRSDTRRKLEELAPAAVDLLGHPEKSGCAFCPFQPVGKRRTDGTATPRSWMALRKEHPGLFWKGAAMEWKQIARRLEEGKSVQFLSGARKPVSSIRPGPAVAADPLLETGYEDAPGDDECSSGFCFR